MQGIGRPGRLSGNSDALRVTTKGPNVLMHPLQGQGKIVQAGVGDGHVRMVHPAKNTEPIGHRNHHHPTPGQGTAVVVRLVAPAAFIGAPVDEHQHRFGAGQGGVCPDIEIKTVLGVGRRCHQSGIDTHTLHHAVIPGQTAARLQTGRGKLPCIQGLTGQWPGFRAPPTPLAHRRLGEGNTEKLGGALFIPYTDDPGAAGQNHLGRINARIAPGIGRVCTRCDNPRGVLGCRVAAR